MRRQLWETLSDLVDALTPSSAEQTGLAITSVLLSLPLVVQMGETSRGFVVTADLPQSLWANGITERVDHISVQLVRTSIQTDDSENTA